MSPGHTDLDRKGCPVFIQVPLAPVQELTAGPGQHCESLPATLVARTMTGGGRCVQNEWVQIRLPKGVVNYAAVWYSTVGEGTRWWVNGATLGPKSVAGEGFSYRVPKGYGAWSAAGGAGPAGSCAVPAGTLGTNGWGVTSKPGATLGLAGHGRGGLTVKSTVTVFGHISNATLHLSLRPANYLSNFSGGATSKSGDTVSVTKGLGSLGAGKHLFAFSARVASLFAGARQTVHAMNDVGGSKHWQDAAPALAGTGGNQLIFSDSPEYLLGKKQTKKLRSGKTQVILPTELANGQVAGDSVEGVLYKQTTLSASGDFRVYLNHENRTPVSKVICVVIAARGLPSASTTLVQNAVGEGEKPGDPVAAGARALASYERSRRSFAPQSTVLDATHQAYRRCFGPIVNKGAAGVVNAILDFQSSGPVQVGVVAINSNRKSDFEASPLAYQFADAQHPHGDPTRSFETDGPLQNPGESHVAGTFAYDEVSVNATMNLDDAEPFGMLLAGNPKKNSPGQYLPALDHSNKDNNGNYGVFYHVTINVAGSPDERAEIVFNPRGVGFDPKIGVTNAFAGIADVPSAADPSGPGREIRIPASGAIKKTTDGTVLGYVPGGQTFSFDFMPPGGAVAPDAIVVLPAFVRVEGTLDYKGWSAVGAPDPLLVGLG